MKKLSKRLLFAGISTLSVFLLNKSVFALATIKDLLRETRGHYYQWKFGKIFYTAKGKGPAILLIHDSQVHSSSFEFHRIVNTLSKQYRVYTIDLLGYGRSDKPKLTYTAYMFVQLLIDFRKDIIREETSLITSGKSCAFATMACHQDHELFKNLVFINPTDLRILNRNPRNKDKLLKFLIEAPLVGTSLYSIIASKIGIRKFFNNNIFSPLKLKQRYIDAFYESAHLSGSSSKYVYASNKCFFNNVNIMDAISQINNNIYLIQGSKRFPDSRAVVEDYRDLNPAIETSYVERSKSLPHLEKPESTLEALAIYLR